MLTRLCLGLCPSPSLILSLCQRSFRHVFGPQIASRKRFRYGVVFQTPFNRNLIHYNLTAPIGLKQALNALSFTPTPTSMLACVGSLPEKQSRLLGTHIGNSRQLRYSGCWEVCRISAEKPKKIACATRPASYSFMSLRHHATACERVCHIAAKGCGQTPPGGLIQVLPCHRCCRPSSALL